MNLNIVITLITVLTLIPGITNEFKQCHNPNNCNNPNAWNKNELKHNSTIDDRDSG
jgi:hypothetical protein